jgi:hypothetical protein
MSALVTARDLPELRARMAAWAQDPGPDGAANWFAFFLGPRPPGVTESTMFDPTDDAAAVIAGTLRAQLPAAELFYVSSAMTELARHAADTLTDYRLHPHDLPAPVGLLVYQHPPVDRTSTDRHDGITLVSWGPGRGGLWVHTWAQVSTAWNAQGGNLGRTLAQVPHQEVLARARRAAQRAPTATPGEPPTAEQVTDHYLVQLLPNLLRGPIPPSFNPTHGYDWCALTLMEFTDIDGWPTWTTDPGPSVNPDVKIALERTIVATWLLMGQTLTRSEHLTAPRPARRRIARTDPNLDPTVRYIDLRRARTEPTDHTTDQHTSGRHYRHRWIVRGHWRNQYYPSRGDHRPIWIDPHLAGPEHLPLLGGERVNVLRR